MSHHALVKKFMPEPLDLEFARRLALHQQGLLRQLPRWGRGANGALGAVQALGYVQLDAIAVIQRAHHHTLFSRVPGYEPAQLYRLLERQKLFEYWHHAVAFMPMDHYRYYHHRRERVRLKARHWFVVDAAVKRHVLDRLRAEGPLYARDYEGHGHVSKGMWDGKPAKKALHELFMEGAVMVRARHSFQRQYDLPERVLPADIDLSAPTPLELGCFAVRSALSAHGFVRKQEVHYLQSDLNAAVGQAIAAMLEAGELVEVTIAQVPKQRYYSTPAFLEQNLRRVEPRLHILSPFDNAVIQRKRLNELFGFDYQTEIYLPPAKRRYGYFALPLLYGTRFIGRMDPKAERDNATLLIRNLELEAGVPVGAVLVEKLAARLREFAEFNGCERVVLDGVADAKLKRALRGRLSGG
jgi:uncharacterized protein YcaQ